MILTTISLDEIKNSPSSTFYKSISPFYKAVYEPDESIVLENFSEISLDFLSHVSRVITALDISPYFIRVRTNQLATQQFFQGLAEPISVEMTSGTPKSGISKVIPIFNDKGIMCAHAWAGLHINPDGTVRLCCEYNGLIRDQQDQPFNIREHPIDHIINSEYMVQIRQYFRSGQTPVQCQKCETYENNHGTSKRSLTPFKLSNIYHDIDWEADHVHDTNLFIGGHLGNICNLKCRICNEKYSSQIAIEKIQHGQLHNKTGQLIKEDMIQRNWKASDPFFWQRLKNLDRRARNFEFLGGEPLLLSKNLEFMQHLLDTGHSKDCIFEFVTNGTQYPDVFDRANEFKRLTITVSIDDIGPRFEYQRKNADWNLVSSNLAKFVAARDRSQGSMEIGISITVNIQNVLYLPEVIRWIKEQRVDHYYVNVLMSPGHFCIQNLTAEAKKLVLDRLKNAKLASEDMEKIQSVIRLIEKSSGSDGKIFAQEMQNVDLIRKENFSEHHKDIANAMGYVLQ